MKNFLGIMGGLGPAASAFLYYKIVKSTQVDKDQDHIDILIYNHSTIPNRNDYLLKRTTINPVPFLIEDIKQMETLGASLIVMPCNTAHLFYDELQSATNVKILNLIQDTVEHIKQKGIKKVGILGTDATIGLELYQKELKKNNIEFCVPSKSNQKKVMSIIYDEVKGGKELSKQKIESVLKEFENSEVKAVIMGCTELSIIKEKLNLNDFYIDPLEVQTKIILKYFKKELKNENRYW